LHNSEKGSGKTVTVIQEMKNNKGRTKKRKDKKRKDMENYFFFYLSLFLLCNKLKGNSI